MPKLLKSIAKPLFYLSQLSLIHVKYQRGELVNRKTASVQCRVKEIIDGQRLLVKEAQQSFYSSSHQFQSHIPLPSQ